MQRAELWSPPDDELTPGCFRHWYGYGWFPVEICPYCDVLCEADWVDVGVGYVQCGPYHCECCGASEIGPYDKQRPLSEDEQRFGWYEPDSEPGSSANVIGGKIVSARAMDNLYRQTFSGNPLYEKEGYVENWWKEIRK